MPELSAVEIASTLRHASPRNVAEWRALRRDWSRRLRSVPGEQVVALGIALLDEGPWGRVTAYELIASHRGGVAALGPTTIRRLGRGLTDWGSVDAFGCYLAGPAWREGRIPTRQVEAWLRSKDRWLRRLAVVCTVALNVRARGGRGDVDRTLAICRQGVTDHDDMVIKALSWALRSLVEWDRKAVEAFLNTHQSMLAARVKREVLNKLRTGRKNR